MRELFFQELEQIYQNLNRSLPSGKGNLCGDCYHCCTTAELTEHRVTALEIDYLESRVGEDKIASFLNFLDRSPNTVCPYYQGGCTVYEARPYSCRTFGHYRREDTPLPEICVFRGQEAIFGVGKHRHAVPQSAELTELSRRYWTHRTPRQGSGSSVYQAAGLEEQLAEALDHLRLGRLEEAVESALQEPSRDPFSLYCKSLILEEAGRSDLTCGLLIEALQAVPASADLWYRLGSVLLSQGELDGALTALKQTVECRHEQPTAWGLLGLIYFHRQEWPQAVLHLQTALALDPSQSAFQERMLEAQNRMFHSP